MSHSSPSYGKQITDLFTKSVYTCTRIIFYTFFVFPILLFISIAGLHGVQFGLGNIFNGNLFPTLVTLPIFLIIIFAITIRFLFFAYGFPTKVIDSLRPKDMRETQKHGIDL